MAVIEESHVDVDGLSVFVRRVPGPGAPAVFVHGNPTHSEDWLPFLERMRAPAIAFDLPGWGASDTPDPREFDYTMDGQSRFVSRLLERLGIDRYRLVVHDWGVVGLIAAQRAPERVERLVIFNTVPILPGYRWHPIARYVWRIPLVGEAANLLTRKWTLSLASRFQTRFAILHGELVERIWRHWRRGFWRPMLILYRSADPDALAAAGSRLAELRCPALVVAAHRDPYTGGAIRPRRCRAAAERRGRRARRRRALAVDRPAGCDSEGGRVPGRLAGPEPLHRAFTITPQSWGVWARRSTAGFRRASSMPSASCCCSSSSTRATRWSAGSPTAATSSRSRTPSA